MSYTSAMEAAGAVIHEEESFGSYQGDWLACITYEGRMGIVHGSYGSCSGCDAFEAEFGYSEPACPSHTYTYPRPEDCTDCKQAEAANQQKLAAFGREYAESMMTPDELQSYEVTLAEQTQWDSDAPGMQRFVKAHKGVHDHPKPKAPIPTDVHEADRLAAERILSWDGRVH